MKVIYPPVHDRIGRDGLGSHEGETVHRTVHIPLRHFWPRGGPNTSTVAVATSVGPLRPPLRGERHRFTRLLLPPFARVLIFACTTCRQVCRGDEEWTDNLQATMCLVEVHSPGGSGTKPPLENISEACIQFVVVHCKFPCSNNRRYIGSRSVLGLLL